MNLGSKAIAIFASGEGSNAVAICSYFEGSSQITVSKLFCNNPKAKVISRLQEFQVPVTLVGQAQLSDKEFISKELLGIDLIVLAGFLKLIPGFITKAFSGRILNIHPALLPKYGGKGMYGDKVHQAVLDAGESASGITIHQVTEHYDEGAVLFQAQIEISKDDDLQSLKEKVQELEHHFYPRVIDELLKEKRL